MSVVVIEATSETGSVARAFEMPDKKAIEFYREMTSLDFEVVWTNTKFKNLDEYGRFLAKKTQQLDEQLDKTKKDKANLN